MYYHSFFICGTSGVCFNYILNFRNTKHHGEFRVLWKCLEVLWYFCRIAYLPSRYCAPCLLSDSWIDRTGGRPHSLSQRWRGLTVVVGGGGRLGMSRGRKTRQKMTERSERASWGPLISGLVFCLVPLQLLWSRWSTMLRFVTEWACPIFLRRCISYVLDSTLSLDAFWRLLDI